MKDRRDARYYRHMEKLKKREQEATAQRNSPRTNLNLFWLALFFIAEKSLFLLHEKPSGDDVVFDIIMYLVCTGCGMYCLVKYFRTRKAELDKTDWLKTPDYAARKVRDYRSNLWFWIPIAVFCLAMVIVDAIIQYTLLLNCGMLFLFAAALLLVFINFKNYRKAKEELNERKDEDA